MRKNDRAGLAFSPSDLITYLASPFASWMDRHHVESPGAFEPDEETEDQKLIVDTGLQHEKSVLDQMRGSCPDLVDATSDSFEATHTNTLEAMRDEATVIYQAALTDGQFSGYADFLIRAPSGRYQVWDAKLARSPKPYYAVQLACYSELLAAADGGQLPAKLGLFLGSDEKVELRVEDFIHFYRRLRSSFLSLQTSYTGDPAERPEPMPGAEHGRWTSHAEKYLDERDHLWRVAGITSGQIKKLNSAGITTLTELAGAGDISVRRLPSETLNKLRSQAILQFLTREARLANPDTAPRYELLPHIGDNGEPLGLATLPPADPGDVFFDIEGYPLVAGGLEYLFGACVRSDRPDCFEFLDWWAHDRAGEKKAFEEFIDWAYKRWRDCPGMHIYHYAAYEVTALRRLSTRHDTRQDEVDDLLRNNVFVDLYRVVRQGLRIGEDSYSIKSVERLYRPKRDGEVASATDSVVRYAQWMESGQPPDWQGSSILSAIRDYNIDDCESTAELLSWLSGLVKERKIAAPAPVAPPAPATKPDLPPEVITRLETISKLRQKDDEVSRTLADLVDFHRREQKPVLWEMFDRAIKDVDGLKDDHGCIAEVQSVGAPYAEKRSWVQDYQFDPAQECAISAGDRTQVRFTHDLSATFSVPVLDAKTGRLTLKIGKSTLDKKMGGVFPATGSIIEIEPWVPEPVRSALHDVAASHLDGNSLGAAAALLARSAPEGLVKASGEHGFATATCVATEMDGECLVIQGPPGSGKTYTGSRVINSLVASGAKVGIASNSHKAINNLLAACGDAARESGSDLKGVKALGDDQDPVFAANPHLRYVSDNASAHPAYTDGVVAGTAWLFARLEWEGALDYLFIDEAGQVSLAFAIAMSRCARNLVLLGDQMQLEQPLRGAHPGDAGLSVLQYALKDGAASKPDAPAFHAVVPDGHGLFLGESRRMHPSVCSFISDSFYEGRLGAHESCHKQRIEGPSGSGGMVDIESGIVFSGVDHEGNVQRSDEEAERVKVVYEELLGRSYTSANGKVKDLALEDFLFITPYNAQVRALEDVLPKGARVGSVDRFQGQEAPVCILSLCSSFGEYGSRGLGFILDRNRINVAISRAQCLAVVVADPRIATSTPSSLDEMRLLNLFCKLSENTHGTVETDVCQAIR